MKKISQESNPISTTQVSRKFLRNARFQENRIRNCFERLVAPNVMIVIFNNICFIVTDIEGLNACTLQMHWIAKLSTFYSKPASKKTVLDTLELIGNEIIKQQKTV